MNEVWAVPLPGTGVSLSLTLGSVIFLTIFGTLFVTGWIALARMWGRRSGWQQLARRYPGVERRTGQRIRVRSPHFRGGWYYRGAHLTAGESHLHFQLFRLVGHSPFSVPWTDISAQKDPHWLGKDWVTFNFAKEPDVPFKVRGSDAKRIIDASRGRVRLADEAKPAGINAVASRV